MRRTDILLAVLVVVLAVGLIFGPPLIRKWRESGETTQANVTESVAPAESVESGNDARNAALSEAAEVERVSGMLMLYKACANRIDGFDDTARPVFQSWKEQHEATLAKRGAELDFHIVLADPEGIERAAGEKARDEERQLCERNVEAMQEDLDKQNAPAAGE